MYFLLTIKDIRKEYVTGDLKQTALDGVSLNFRDNEFVAILGPSGSGKTTMLNVIGGLDRYDSGDLVINGISTKKYKDRDWDSYRNHTIGFVFQSYNLIPHQSILSNVELALTISGVSKGERRKRAKEALEKVGLGDQLHKRPSQMSGGQMQRVAIARALVNDPDILLADEPTGALDSETSIQVMDLLNEVADDRLVIMVTHNPELAEKYATRIVKLSDGKIIDDSNPFEVEETKEPEHKKMGKSSMSFLTSLSLSFNNLRTKKGRTILTSFAGSIGIIGIALIQSLSSGVNAYIDNIQRETMASYPITIDAQTIDLTSIMANSNMNVEGASGEPDHKHDAVYSNGARLQMAADMSSSFTKNNLTKFKEYLDNKDSEIHKYVGENGIVYSYDTKFGLYTYDKDGTLINTDGSTLNDESSTMQFGSITMSSSYGSSTSGMGSMFDNKSNFTQLIPGPDGKGVSSSITDNYDVIYGSMPKKYDEMVLVVDENNELPLTVLYQLGILPVNEYRDTVKQIASYKEVKIETHRTDYSDICSREYYLMPASDLYEKNSKGTYNNIANDELKLEDKLKSAIKLKITGIVKAKEENKGILIKSYVGYTKELTDYLMQYAENSEIVKAQKADKNTNILTGLSFKAETDEEKLNNIKKYIASLSTSEKAEMLTSLWASISRSNPDIAEMLTAQVKQQMPNANTAPNGQAAPQQKIDIQSMSEDQLASIFDTYLTSPDKDMLLSIYDRYISEGSYEDNLKLMGVVSVNTPSSIDIYADSFESKDSITHCIEAYNKTADENDKITYTDYVGLLMSSVTTIVNVISYVLIAFVAVSLIVSSIMIGIITYISVLERTKEIGILRAIGASKRNISSVFNAETFIIGLISGLMGIGISLLMLFPINGIIHAIAESNDVNAFLPLTNAIVLVVLSVLLTLIGGIIPSRKAAKKDPVGALREI